MSLGVSRALDGSALRLTLDHGKGNVIDGPLVGELSEALAKAHADLSLRCVLLEATGPDFSFGVSVPEHRAEEVARTLTRFHGLIRQMLDLPLPILAAVKGRCLGGALELALAASRVFLHPSAQLGVPEVRLAVFAPVGSALLPERVGQARAEELLYSGRSVPASEAVELGLSDELVAAEADPSAEALGWAQRTLSTHSPQSLRFAVKAARGPYAARVSARISELEGLYLNGLMATPDANEGIQAFLEKRPPRWQAKEAR
ncbi:MAG: enoyl-CoA hydratase/isomerase family protein [Myxococcales bacterium]|nr:enoyl-CoA hydratase/isomerase family protein [Myxococcales bacterium]